MGIVVAPEGALTLVLRFVVRVGIIEAVEIVGDPERLARLELAILGSRPISL